MGYESRIYIVERHEYKTWAWGSEIARFDLCKMGYYMFDGKSFRDLFKKEIDFDLNINVEDKEHYNPEDYRTDAYGAHCKYTDIETVIYWLEIYIKEENYRRAELFLNFLYTLKEQIKKGMWGEICIVHYGY